MKVFRTPRFLPWMYPKRTWGFSSSDNSVYLTFDDGPTPKLTDWILDFLKQEDIPATFFCVGQNIINQPKEFQKIKDNGHKVGNHTMHHEKGTKTKWQAYRESIEDCDKLTKSRLFRPPYGRISMWQSARLARKHKIVMWSWLSYDYDKNVTIEQILKSAQKEIKAGDILVVHDNEKVQERLKELLPELIRIIREKGLNFKTISA